MFGIERALDIGCEFPRFIRFIRFHWFHWFLQFIRFIRFLQFHWFRWFRGSMFPFQCWAERSVWLWGFETSKHGAQWRGDASRAQWGTAHKQWIFFQIRSNPVKNTPEQDKNTRLCENPCYQISITYGLYLCKVADSLTYHAVLSYNLTYHAHEKYHIFYTPNLKTLESLPKILLPSWSGHHYAFKCVVICVCYSWLILVAVVTSYLKSSVYIWSNYLDSS